MSGKREIDDVTGVETTGHTWDDIKELNKPLPKWWLMTFYASIVWAIGYMIVYPAWPTLNGYTKGIWGYSQRVAVSNEVQDAKAAQATFRAALEKTSLADVKNDPDLLRFAMVGGAAAFATNCAPCHGRGAQGFAGYPNLNDDDWLWGGTLADIERTISYGIRSGDKEARVSDMPKYGLDGILKPAEINDAAEYVLSLSKRATDSAAAERGAKIFADQCVTCHGADGKGNAELGAPNLTDEIWLYGGQKPAIVQSITTGRGGSMPAWHERLDPVTLKSLAIYVHSLGGGR
ncbi:MAG TPA: cytochrome-c oxidase, cbb3-type subunit III [Hyphomicrobiaceae bacterium]|nr:cytochrome-c oxidase, cbb3-type subunit III [Hyphomicrobiaceae bacterium]